MSSMLIRVGELESQVHAEGVFKTDISLWKQIKCFPSTLRSKAEEYHQSFEFVFQENPVSQITWLVSFQNDFRAHENGKPGGVFQFVRFEERFRKALFSWGISVDGTEDQNVEIKLRFQISSV